jgi:hypothetical protein
MLCCFTAKEPRKLFTQDRNGYLILMSLFAVMRLMMRRRLAVTVAPTVVSA